MEHRGADRAVDALGAVTSAAGLAAKLLSEEIIGGQLKPGRKLILRELRARTGLGPTPIREGLTRLTSRGLVVIVDQKGFFVPPLDGETLDDYFRVRLLVENEALRSSVVNGDMMWEERVTAALSRLERFKPSARENAANAIRTLSTLHKDLAMELVSKCASRRLQSLLDVFHDQQFLYCNNLVRQKGRVASFAALLDTEGLLAIVELALARDAGAACEKLAEHLHWMRERLAFLYNDVA